MLSLVYKYKVISRYGPEGIVRKQLNHVRDALAFLALSCISARDPFSKPSQVVKAFLVFRFENMYKYEIRAKLMLFINHINWMKNAISDR